MKGTAGVLMGPMLKGTNHQCHEREAFLQTIEAYLFLTTDGAEGRYTEGDSS